MAYQRFAKGPYRAGNGLFLGVLQGLADHFRISAFILRLAVVFAALFLAFWPVAVLYFVSALIMPAEPNNL
ncbi:MAG: PspC domain-containing protein [Deltaproteobacteria bacterium]|jgi:phage shock protein C|nr:PspC domain-containing protein [Deltaproteobacteria bacterium]